MGGENPRFKKRKEITRNGVSSGGIRSRVDELVCTTLTLINKDKRGTVFVLSPHHPGASELSNSCIQMLTRRTEQTAMKAVARTLKRGPAAEPASLIFSALPFFHPLCTGGSRVRAE
jgi:hypothetical protein